MTDNVAAAVPCAEPVTVETPRGPGRLIVSAPTEPATVLLLGHGAGGGVNGFDLAALATELPAAGIAVVRYAQPWLVAGKKVAGPPASLDEGWVPALAAVRQLWDGLPLFVGGRSAGARVACRCFDESQAGVVALSFPLHPPGKPQKSRVSELLSVRGPVLVVQGERDPFGTPAEIRTAASVGVRGPVDGAAESRAVTEQASQAAAAGAGVDVRLVQIAAAGHSLQPGKRSDPDGARARIVDAVRSFVRRI